MDFIIRKRGTVIIRMADGESEAVKIAAANLETDLKKVLEGVKVIRCSEDWTVAGDMGQTGKNPKGKASDSVTIRIGTIGVQKQAADGAAAGTLREEKGGLRREAYRLQVKEGQLFITGTDRRGTVYGIYTLCERLGVSPWYFFADVPVRAREEFVLPEGYCVTDWPSVEYRGIFINDEEELESWVQNYMKESTIGVKTYERIFELLLRLRANYIWPAMHVNSFNLKPENGALAERMGIVVGTSHCDMLMRSNNREWIPWITRKGYTDAVYDYSVEGRNREILQEYWRESVEQNRDFEVCYTLGMRGIHDSGFETKALSGKSEEEKRQAKVELLERIIRDQRGILKDTLGDMPMMTFIPYKEVLELYDNGLEVPEDMTLVWANDNYGYIRRFPSEKERKRKGGNGIYYHNSYWAPPGMSYVFLCSIPLAHTRNELQKAWDEGIRKLWVLNSGAIKPLEQEVTFFLRLAWEIGKEGALTEDVEAFTASWMDGMFTGDIGREAASLLHDFAQLTNVRKLENMDYDAFSQTAYGDEAAVRIHEYEKLFEKGNALYRTLPEEERDAFYQLALMRIHAGYFTNLAFYYGDRSTLMYERGNLQAAARYTERSRFFGDVRRRMIRYYNSAMSEGKWNGILNPEGYPPPRAAMLPVCTPPLKIGGKPGMRVDVWNEGDALEFVSGSGKWIEIGNTGGGRLAVEVNVPDWLRITAADGGTDRDFVNLGEHSLRAEVETELRVCLSVADCSEICRGEIVAESPDEGKKLSIPVRLTSPGHLCPAGEAEDAVSGTAERNTVAESGPETAAAGRTVSGIPAEEDGMVVLEADSALELAQAECDFHIVRRLGRGKGNLVEARRRRQTGIGAEQETEAPAGEGTVSYSFYTFGKGTCLLEIHRFPSLASTGRIRVGVSLDGEPMRTVESFSNDEWRGNWRNNVLNNADRLYIELEIGKAGRHCLKLYAIDSYFAFSRLVIYTRPRKENNLAGISGSQRLPMQWDAEEWCRKFYGETELRPVAAEYVTDRDGRDSIPKSNLIPRPEAYADKVEPEWYLQRGKRIFEESGGAVRIDAAAVLAQSGFAWGSSELWRHCGGESFGRSGLCMYVRERNLKWENPSDAPALHYRFCCQGGHYTLWMLCKFNQPEESCYRVGADGETVPEAALYHGGKLFRYEAEQIYQWVPAAEMNLEKGEHVLDVYAMASGMRFDRFYLTRGTELPPMDTEW